MNPFIAAGVEAEQARLAAIAAQQGGRGREVGGGSGGGDGIGNGKSIGECNRGFFE